MRGRGSLRLLCCLPTWPGPLFSPVLHSPSLACGALLMTSPQSPLSFLSSVSQPHLLCPSLLRGPLPCPVWAPTHLPLPEAPGRPRAQGLTAACRSPCCRPSSATRPSTCMPWGPSISSARPQVLRMFTSSGRRMGASWRCVCPRRPTHCPMAGPLCSAGCEMRSGRAPSTAALRSPGPGTRPPRRESP